MRTGRPKTPAPVRFFAMVSQQGECWLWQGDADRRGYGAFWDGRRVTKAHRWAYEFLRTEIPLGLFIDHLCRTPGCVNPWHLEPVTQVENSRRARGDRCSQGHPYSLMGDRQICRECRRGAFRRYNAKRRAAA